MELRRIHMLIARGLASTAEMWPAIRYAYEGLHTIAHLLNNADGADVLEVRHGVRHVLHTMRGAETTLGDLAPAVRHVRKVSRSYWSGLFVHYLHPAIPRTNNDLEHCFGTLRYHQRRASGRKIAGVGVLVRGSVGLVAAVQEASLSAAELRPHDVAAWQALRSELRERHQTRSALRRFRRNPAAYLATAEALLLPATLPS